MEIWSGFLKSHLLIVPTVNEQFVRVSESAQTRLSGVRHKGVSDYHSFIIYEMFVNVCVYVSARTSRSTKKSDHRVQ